MLGCRSSSTPRRVRPLSTSSGSHEVTATRPSSTPRAAADPSTAETTERDDPTIPVTMNVQAATRARSDPYRTALRERARSARRRKISCTEITYQTRSDAGTGHSLARSETMNPSRTRTTRSAIGAMPSLCVTMTTVVPYSSRIREIRSSTS